MRKVITEIGKFIVYFTLGAGLALLTGLAYLQVTLADTALDTFVQPTMQCDLVTHQCIKNFPEEIHWLLTGDTWSFYAF